MNAPFLQRPIFGGPFGTGRYFLATTPHVSKGLHSVRFMVIDPRAGAVLSIAEAKTEALAAARRLLLPIDTGQAGADPQQAKLWPDDRLEELVPAATAAPPGRRRPVSRRRREVFARSDGRCHYCATALWLDGRWHVEHQMPRALGGGDELPNLVAACVPCNLSKRDRTAVEFVALGKEGRPP